MLLSAIRSHVMLLTQFYPQAGRYGAAHGGTAGPGGDRQHKTPTTALFAQVKTNSFTPKTILGHALHEKGLQRQKGVVPLVGSQKERALLIPVINRISAADESVVNLKFCSRIRFT